jgi:hypothetical protein
MVSVKVPEGTLRGLHTLEQTVILRIGWRNRQWTGDVTQLELELSGLCATDRERNNSLTFEFRRVSSVVSFGFVTLAASRNARR